MITRTQLGRTGLALVAAGALATTAATAAAPTRNTLPAAPPTDATAAGLSIFTTKVPGARLGGKANRYFYTTNGGGQVRISRVVTRRFTGRQTLTLTPPSGATILQGFATISGGNTGSMIITSTQTVRGRYIVRVAMPGEQGTPGRLTIRIQVENRDSR